MHIRKVKQTCDHKKEDNRRNVNQNDSNVHHSGGDPNQKSTEHHGSGVLPRNHVPGDCEVCSKHPASLKNIMRTVSCVAMTSVALTRLYMTWVSSFRTVMQCVPGIETVTMGTMVTIGSTSDLGGCCTNKIREYHTHHCVLMAAELQIVFFANFGNKKEQPHNTGCRLQQHCNTSRARKSRLSPPRRSRVMKMAAMRIS